MSNCLAARYSNVECLATIRMSMRLDIPMSIVDFLMVRHSNVKCLLNAVRLDLRMSNVERLYIPMSNVECLMV